MIVFTFDLEFFMLIGAQTSENHRITTIALQGGNLKVYGDGNYMRDYVYITDVVNAFLFAGVTPQLGGQSFNVATAIGTTVKQAFELVATQAEKTTGKPIEVSCIDWPTETDSIEFREFTADISKYITATNWKPRINIKEGIALLITESIKKGAV